MNRRRVLLNNMILTDITNSAVPKEKTAVALGYFDGLHLGHKVVINAALSQNGLKPAVFTFNCDTTLPKFKSPEDIISFPNKCEMLDEMGVKYLYAPDFADVCKLTYEEFAKVILVGRLNSGFVCCGRNFRFGLGGYGTPKRLQELGKKYGFDVRIVPDVCLDGELISSTHIREFIRRGEIRSANRLLGYDLWFKLPVVHGNEIGRTISFPTINQVIPKTNIIPKFGVYKSSVKIDGRSFQGITNIGIRPTIEGSEGVFLETHILNFSADLYGRNIAVSLSDFIRPEKKFAGLNELKEQISKDIAAYGAS